MAKFRVEIDGGCHQARCGMEGVIIEWDDEDVPEDWEEDDQFRLALIDQALIEGLSWCIEKVEP